MKEQIIDSFSNDLKALIENIIIKEKKIFVTLKAKNPKEAKELQGYKTECEEKIAKFKVFNEVNVTFTLIRKKFSKVIAISSCKGGVGKSTVSVNLSMSLKKKGLKVGLLDADIYGPSIPNLLNLSEKPEVNADKKILPLHFDGLEAISIGLLIDQDKPLIWRGPMLQSAIMQLVNDVAWSNLDYLVIDMPPGTGDTHLTLMQKLEINHVVVVTTPQDISLADTRKGINMFKKFNIPISGVVENMSYFICNNCDEKHYMYGKGGGKKLSEEFNIKLLGKIPFDTLISDSSDRGNPNLIHENKDLSSIYDNIIDNLIN